MDARTPDGPETTGPARRRLGGIAVTAALAVVGLTEACTARPLSAGAVQERAVQEHAAQAGTRQADTGPADTGPGTPGPREALRLLKEGNRRWASGHARHPHQSVPWRWNVAAKQAPFATVVSCIDSRVPPEIVFDRGIGDMFTIRTGAQALDESVVLGSIEFGPHGYPSARLMVVLGHQQCGAISAAIESIESGVRAPGHIQAVVDALRPAYYVAKTQPGDLADNMTRAQTRLTVCRLRQDPLLRCLAATKGLMIVGGHYYLRSGLVEIIA
jgi:carbonic anhydrase